MTEDLIASQIPGAVELIARFGRWPSFHDAEIISMELNRAGVSRIKIYAFDMTKRTDSQGFYVLEKHTIVNFLLEDIVDLELIEFSCQNVIFGLHVEKVEAGYKLIFDPCYGVHGTVVAARLSVELEPMKPPQNAICDLAAVN